MAKHVGWNTVLTSRTHTYNNGFPLIKNLLRCVIQEKFYSISFTAYGGYKIYFIDIIKSRKEIVDIPENVMYIFFCSDRSGELEKQHSYYNHATLDIQQATCRF